MKKAAYSILPGTEEILATVGEQIKLARLRRGLSAELVAERAGISRASLWKVEKGEPSVAMGIYAAVLHALNNLDKDLLLIARDDELGRQLQDLNLITKKRAPRGRGWRRSTRKRFSFTMIDAAGRFSISANFPPYGTEDLIYNSKNSAVRSV